MTRRRSRWSGRLLEATCLALLALSPLVAYPALACSGSSCLGAAVFPAGGDIPRDQAVFTIRTGALTTDGGVVMPRLYRVDGDVRSEVPFSLTRSPDVSVSYEPTFELKPTVELAASTKLVLEHEGPSCRPVNRLDAKFTIVDAAPAPTALGALRVTVQRGQLEVATRAGSCSDQRDAAYADLTLELAGSARPFAEVLEYEWVVDGSRYAGFERSLAPALDRATDRPRGTERVYAPCQANQHLISSLSLGTHRAFLRGKLRGGATVTTPEVSFDLQCDPSADQPDAGITAHDAGAERDAATPPQDNTPPSPADAGATVETTRGRSDAGGVGEATDVLDADDGCALTSRGESSQTYAAWLGVFVTVFFASRRRR